MTKKYTRVLPVVAALVLTLGLGVPTVHAQISFGKMRDASEKNKPSLEEDGENKFDVSPDDSKKSKPKTSSSKAVSQSSYPPPVQRRSIYEKSHMVMAFGLVNCFIFFLP